MTIELLQQIVVLKMSNFFDTAAKSQKEHHPGRKPPLSDLHSDTLPLRHTFLHIEKAQAEIYINKGLGEWI